MPASHGTHGSPRPACVGEDQDWPHLPSLQVASVCPGFSLSPLYFEIREGGGNHTEFQNVKSCLVFLFSRRRTGLRDLALYTLGGRTASPWTRVFLWHCRNGQAVPIALHPLASARPRASGPFAPCCRRLLCRRVNADDHARPF